MPRPRRRSPVRLPARRVSGPGERRLPLLHEGADALEEVVGPRQLVLDLSLQVELPVEVRIDHPVERALGTGVGARRALGQPARERARLVEQPVVRVDPVHEAPFERLPRGDALAEQPRPAPVISTARTESSAAGPVTMSRSSAPNCAVQALSVSGRFRVIRPTPSATSHSTVLSFIPPPRSPAPLSTLTEC